MSDKKNLYACITHYFNPCNYTNKLSDNILCAILALSIGDFLDDKKKYDYFSSWFTNNLNYKTCVLNLS